MKIAVTLLDANGVEIESQTLSPQAAVELVGNFLLLHGTDPDRDGESAMAGSIRFEPVPD